MNLTSKILLASVLVSSAAIAQTPPEVVTGLSVSGDVRSAEGKRRLEVRWSGTDDYGVFRCRSWIVVPQGSIPTTRHQVRHNYRYTSDLAHTISSGTGAFLTSYYRSGFSTKFGEVRFTRPIRWRSSSLQKLRGTATLYPRRIVKTPP